MFVFGFGSVVARVLFRLFLLAEYPDGRPQLWTDHERYEPGDVLRANCSSPPSRPRVELRLTLNNIVVRRHF